MDFFWVNPCGENDQLVVDFSLAKKGWAKRSKKREAKLRVKNKNLKYFWLEASLQILFKIFIFDAKLRFALFASLRSAFFSQTEVDN